jgi:hypothetical protein
MVKPTKIVKVSTCLHGVVKRLTRPSRAAPRTARPTRTCATSLQSLDRWMTAHTCETIARISERLAWPIPRVTDLAANLLAKHIANPNALAELKKLVTPQESYSEPPHKHPNS